MKNISTQTPNWYNFFSKFFRCINLLNPTSYGRYLITSLAVRVGAVPPDGVYEVKPNIHLYLETKDYIDRSLYFDSFEFTTQKIIRKHLALGYTFIDIGANIGYYSLLANQIVGKNGRVIAFEPNPVTIERIKKNIALNNASNVELVEVALSNKVGKVQLFCPVDETHGFTSMKNHGWENANCYDVSTQPLDEIIPKDVTRIDLIKIDVEGAELLVFQGASKTIREFKPKIILELNEKAALNFGYDILDVVKLLISFNGSYKLQYFDEHSFQSLTMDDLLTKSIRNGSLFLH